MESHLETRNAGRREGRLLERETELAAIGALVEQSAEGQGHLVLVEGPAGIGKTRLVAEGRRLGAGAGFRVLAARASELEREFPYGVVRQLFEAALAEPGAAAALLEGSAAAARPVLGPITDADTPPIDVSFAALHGLYWLCLNLCGERPLMLAVDDLHWCDRASLRFLAYLTRRLEGLPLAIIASVRPLEPDADTAFLGELSGEPLAVPVRPTLLSATATAGLIGDRLGASAADEMAVACHRATGGNPLLLDELLASLASEGAPAGADVTALLQEVGPRAVSRSVGVRLARLDAVAVAVARAVAVLGEPADLSLVARLADVDERTAAEATGSLARAEILRPDPPLGFVHPLVRTAVYHDVPPGERELQHARAAEDLHSAGASSERVAAHLLASPARGRGWAVDVLAEAARQAMSRGAAESAAAYLTRAVSEPPDDDRVAELLLLLGTARALTRGADAAEPLRRALGASGDPVQRARIALKLAEVLYFTSQPREAAAVTVEATSALDPEHSDLVDHLAAWRLVVARFDPLQVPPLADDELRRRLPTGDSLGSRALAGAIAYQWALGGARAADAVPVALMATGGGALSSPEAAGAHLIGAVIVLIMADREDALAATQELLAAAHRHGSLLIAVAAHLFRGLALCVRGELAEAERLFVESGQNHAAWGSDAVKLFPGAYLAQVQIDRGDVAGAGATLAAVGMPADLALPENDTVAWWLHARLRHRVAAGQFAEALVLADECERRFAATVSNPAWIPWRSLKATALHRLGRVEEAVAAARSELPDARHWGAPRALGRSLRVLGEVSGDQDALDEAVAVLAPSPARLDYARALAAQGTALRLRRRLSEAREPLRHGLEIATNCEAAALVVHLRDELRAAGVRPRNAALSGAGALTASERRVARMAAEGASNKDIAQALYVTPKTVEAHLSSAYRKLGIRTRHDLHRAMASV